jgi:dienelactone hydrolase
MRGFILRVAAHCAAFAALLLSTHLVWAAEDYRTLTPTSPPPHPAVLLVPGCSGFSALNGLNIYEERAAELRAAGYLVVFVDYLGRFGNCGRMSHAQVGDAILDAAAWVRDQNGTDPTQIAVIGWSYGGGGVIAALKAMPTGTPLLTKAVMYYPDCRGEIAWSGSAIPALMFFGADDDVARPALCAAVIKGAPQNGSRVVTYPNAYHAFDVSSLPQRAQYPFGILGYNAQAADDSWRTIRDFLR